jgi:hypothetical protein
MAARRWEIHFPLLEKPHPIMTIPCCDINFLLFKITIQP